MKKLKKWKWKFFFDPHKKVLFSKFFETGQKGSKGQILTLIKPSGIKTQNKAVDLKVAKIILSMLSKVTQGQ